MPMPEQLNPKSVIKGAPHVGKNVATRTGYSAPANNPVAKPANPPHASGDSQNKGLGTQYPKPKEC